MVAWSYLTKGRVQAITLADGVLYVGNNAATLYALNTTVQ